MITKIQSFTDVITNSSSTVFVMHESDAKYYDRLENTDGCVYIQPITMDWLQNNADEFEMVLDMLNIPCSEITTYHKFNSYYGGYWKTPEESVWEAFLESHKEQIEEVFQDLYWVDIEDHFEDAYEVTEEAMSSAKWYESRH